MNERQAINRFESFLAFLFPTISATFHSRYPLAESVLQLRAASLSSELNAAFRESAVGKVTEQQVRLVRSGPLSSNRYKPHFIGTFRQNGEAVVLAGQFAASTWVKAYGLFGICFCTLMFVLALVGTAFGKSHAWWTSLIPLSLLALDILGIRVSQWSARNDVAWLSRVIEQALDSPSETN